LQLGQADDRRTTETRAMRQMTDHMEEKAYHIQGANLEFEAVIRGGNCRAVTWSG
jgi:hypothetical protein